ncbi:hypothetical protein [Allokutzneria albata]|uniref:Uncharacterized protein n=1 Tax=Allokutzneria albata TaxID=211114 RepID=A0A1G9UQV6_ALLAB|nr:hypothetical protein [Allokutzneria albata]SDM62282.1 hypothetical protein SAMN04489726_2559 [Allokutzneria albata]
MSEPWGAAVTAVRTDRHGRVAVAFTPTGWELRPDPVTRSDLATWFWWSLGGSIVLAWIGFLPHLAFGVPKEIAAVFAAPGALLLVGLVLYAVVSVIVEVVSFVLAMFGLLTRSGRRRLFSGRAPAPDAAPLVVLPAAAVAGARVTQHWRRVVITVRMVDGVEFRYSRFGMRRPRRALQEGFAALLGSRLLATA